MTKYCWEFVTVNLNASRTIKGVRPAGEQKLATVHGYCAPSSAPTNELYQLIQPAEEAMDAIVLQHAS